MHWGPNGWLPLLYHYHSGSRLSSALARCPSRPHQGSLTGKFVAPSNSGFPVPNSADLRDSRVGFRLSRKEETCCKSE